MSYSRRRISRVDNWGDTIATTERVTPAPVPDEHPQIAYRRKKTIFRSYQIIWYVLGIVEVLLAFRVLLRLFGANPGSSFVSLVYGLSYPLALPFFGVFGTTSASRFALEWSTLFGMIVYAVVAYGLERGLQLVKPTTPEEVESTVDQPV